MERAVTMEGGWEFRDHFQLRVPIFIKQNLEALLSDRASVWFYILVYFLQN